MPEATCSGEQEAENPNVRFDAGEGAFGHRMRYSS